MKNWDDFKQAFLKKEETKVDANSVINNMFSNLEEDTIRIEFGEDILPYIEDVLKVCSDFRFKTFSKSGFILPVVHFLDNSGLQENEYRVFVQGRLAKTDFVIFNKDEIMSEFLKVFDWLLENELEEIFTNETTERYLKFVDDKNYLLAKEFTKLYDMHDIKQIFVNILKNKKSIKNISYIVEKICAVNTENINRNNYDKLFYRPISVERISEMFCE